MTKIYSVSEFVQSFNALIEATLPSVAVSGEVTGFREVQNRMIYFDLKDEKSKMLCFALKWEVPQGIQDGMRLNIVGSPRLFVGSGQFHFRVKEVEFQGEGVLQKLYKELLGRLEKEGLFSEDRKKPLPRYPETIGLITSEDAAAYTDVLKILKEKIECKIWFYPVKVQGLGSESSVVQGLEYFNKHKQVDVMMLVRGGGSMEDLQTFNSEKVARAIASSRIPVVVGVGHERDVTIADLVADRRASTPTNAAEIVLPSKREMREVVSGEWLVISNMINSYIQDRNHLLIRISHMLELTSGRVFESIRLLIGRTEQHAMKLRFSLTSQEHILDRRMTKLSNLMLGKVQSVKHSIELKMSNLAVSDPKHVLGKGYTLTLKSHKVIKSKSQVVAGDEIETRFVDGGVFSVVQK